MRGKEVQARLQSEHKRSGGASQSGSANCSCRTDEKDRPRDARPYNKNEEKLVTIGKGKRRRDPYQLAKWIVDQSTTETPQPEEL